MNYRERFTRYLNYQKVDRVPFFEMGPWPETLNRWYKEGLPINTNFRDYFNFDKVDAVPIDFLPIPRFLSETIEETERYRIWKDETGIVKKELKESESMPAFIEFPVKNRDDWEKIKRRFDPQDPRRYPTNWSNELIEYYNKTNNIVFVDFGQYPLGGFFAFPRSLIGLERLLVSFYKDPNWIHEILDFWVDFIIEVSEDAVKQTRIDYAFIWEDMCYKNGPLVSPKIFEEFMLPRYKRLTSFLRRNGIDLIQVDSDGYVDPLIPLFLEAGVNNIYPLEVAAGMDVLTLRRKYGRDLRLWGGIDKRVLALDKGAIDKEIERVLPVIKDGGYIPHLDHAIPNNVPFKNYVYYVEALRKHLYF